MKIEKVHIKNVKGIKDLELSFKKDDKILDLIVLAGVNGSGKTTILEAIKDFFDNKNVNYDELEKSNINLDIFFEDFEKNNIEEAEKNCKDKYEHKLKELFLCFERL
ncbi:recombination protein F [Fusobacterium animalis ATCC 51191]|uniref:Recombination protein F n=1 Tax=Fusobacterium animalis ATCC 51191 TaxID=997347 RepID=F9EKY6_9FUSO|nr:recombination protein F [Fusobacterium animalis ATCC 51191]